MRKCLLQVRDPLAESQSGSRFANDTSSSDPHLSMQLDKGGIHQFFLIISLISQAGLVVNNLL